MIDLILLLSHLAPNYSLVPFLFTSISFFITLRDFHLVFLSIYFIFSRNPFLLLTLSPSLLNLSLLSSLLPSILTSLSYPLPFTLPFTLHRTLFSPAPSIIFSPFRLLKKRCTAQHANSTWRPLRKWTYGPRPISSCCI